MQRGCTQSFDSPMTCNVVLQCEVVEVEAGPLSVPVGLAMLFTAICVLAVIGHTLSDRRFTPSCDHLDEFLC
eukprot:568084-Amphidinium_carterae.1